MNRRQFVTGLGALGALPLAPLHAVAAAVPAAGSHTTIDALLATVPPVESRRWVQHIMGSGVVYSKKIGTGIERSRLGALPYIETQIGDAQASCNPNTIKKAYTQRAYGELLAPHDVKIYVVKAGTAFSILPTDASDKLYLLDADNLYTRAPGRLVATGRDPVRMHHRTLRTRRYDVVFTPHGSGSLRELSLWLSPEVPFGVAKMHATLASADPFDLHVDAFGDLYFSLVPESLDALRAQGA